MATGTRRAAADAAPPELDQPGTRAGSHGLRASRSQLYWRPGATAARAHHRVGPDDDRPGRAESLDAEVVVRGEAVAVAPRAGAAAGRPPAMCSLTEIGMPCSGPSGSPSATATLGPGGLGAGTCGVDVREGAQDGVKFLDPGEEVVGHLDR